MHPASHARAVACQLHITRYRMYLPAALPVKGVRLHGTICRQLSSLSPTSSTQRLGLLQAQKQWFYLEVPAPLTMRHHSCRCAPCRSGGRPEGRQQAAAVDPRLAISPSTYTHLSTTARAHPMCTYHTHPCAPLPPLSSFLQGACVMTRTGLKSQPIHHAVTSCMPRMAPCAPASACRLAASAALACSCRMRPSHLLLGPSPALSPTHHPPPALTAVFSFLSAHAQSHQPRTTAHSHCDPASAHIPAASCPRESVHL